MRKIVFDIETKNTFTQIGSNKPEDLDLSLIAIYDSETDSYDSFLEDDIGRLWPILEQADVLIGFNSEHFDMPLLNKYYPGDLTQIKHIDLLKDIKQSFGHRIKLDLIAEGTLGVKKSGHGLQAITWWNNGEIEKIRKYCIDDVKITKDIYEYALKNNKVFFKEAGQKIEISLDTSDWETEKKSAMTPTLGF